MRSSVCALTVVVIAGALMLAPAGPAFADEIEETIQAALDAYRDGDVDLAKEELDFASQLLSQEKAAGLAQFLPEPLPGWEREDAETEALGAAMMGGGLSASAVYMRDGDRLEIQFLADNPMVQAMAGMFSNSATMGAMGTVRRINRQKVVVTSDGELQALVNNRIMIQMSGSAPVEDKEAYFAEIDVEGMEDF